MACAAGLGLELTAVGDWPIKGSDRKRGGPANTAASSEMGSNFPNRDFILPPGTFARYLVQLSKNVRMQAHLWPRRTASRPRLVLEERNCTFVIAKVNKNPKTFWHLAGRARSRQLPCLEMW